jgi:hypothetical protein
MACERHRESVPYQALSGLYHDRRQKNHTGWYIAHRTLHHAHREPYLPK